ncbi:GNAT family N-acetyltransferase [Nocardia uniformis]|uniref:GNAT family N-acetyltransferase n=1 Tax=Nocardia uniformis TaxID=53432 RepID=A0A849CFG1_9NOCA|nr:GNAT family N-acetyltransferase [Nocardia uniformis]NNH75257.1 GNAT family N-acetyltransferase [Nocardia uniformis]
MPLTEFTFRTSTAEDQQFLAQMLIEAAVASGHVLTVDDLPETPDSYRYVAEWGKPSDLGVIAHDEHGTPVGAAWARLFDHSNASPAFIDDRTPELTIATVAKQRGRGLGTALLRQLQDTARRSGITNLSLGVHRDNRPAQQLYRNEGWTAHTIAGEYNILVKQLN